MDKATGGVSSAVELLELAESENDEGMAREIEADAAKLETDVRKLEFKRMFRGEMLKMWPISWLFTGLDIWFTSGTLLSPG